jgi:hypothetical protein
MSYATGHWGDARKEFRRYFPVNIGRFYDGWTTVLLGRICLDVSKFDDWLHSVHGRYEDRGLSMEALIIEKYSREAWKLINELL